MPRFHYRARDEFGADVAGDVRAPSRGEALARLSAGGLFVAELERVPAWWEPAGLWRGLCRIGRSLNRPLFSARRPPPVEFRVSEPFISAPPPPPIPTDIDTYVVTQFEQVAGPSLAPGQGREHGSSSPVSANRVEAAVQEAMQSAGLRPVPDVVETALAKFVVDDLSEGEREAWLYFRAVAAVARGDAREAFRRAESGFRIHADSARMRIALADLHERAGNHARMFELLDEMPHPEKSGRITMLAAHYAWLCDDIDRALRYIEPVIDAHFELGSGEDTLMFVRGLPFVADTLYFAAAMHALRDDLPAARRLAAEAQEQLADVDLAEMMLFLDCKQRGDFAPLLEARDREIKLEFTGGIVPVQSAILAAQLTPDPNAAVASLRKIVLPREHYPWLNDVLLLAVCQLAGRIGDAEQEMRLQRDFISRQPLLLQPNHALFFNLLEYQESLKPQAREARRS